jgi:cell division protein FtsL
MIQDIFHLYINLLANFITSAMHKIIINHNYRTIFIAIDINLIE